MIYLNFQNQFLFPWGYIIALLVFSIIFVRLAQNYVKRKSGIKQEIYDAWHNDPDNWKAGIFYYNPKDPRMLPPKRVVSFGWTINFANPYSVIALVATIASCIGIGLFF